MQLVDFQNSISTQEFVELRSTVENKKRNRLNNENNYNYKKENLKVWIRLPGFVNNFFIHIF